MSTEYVISSKVIECGSNERTILLFPLLLALIDAPANRDDDPEEVVFFFSTSWMLIKLIWNLNGMLMINTRDQ